MIKFSWTQPTASGLADRLCDLLYLYVYVSLFNGELHLQWPEYKLNLLDIEHRSEDIKLNNALKYLKFPKTIVFHNNEIDLKLNTNTNFDFYIGGGLTVNDFYNKYVDKKITENEYLNKFMILKNEFSFCDEILIYLSKLPNDFFTLHIRRGDKVRPGFWNDGNFINDHELNELNQLTINAIDKYKYKGFKNIFICGDEDKYLNLFIEYAKSKNLNVLTSVNQPKWIQTYFDLAIMSKSQTVITSQRHSSFARFPTLIGNNDYKTVYNI